MRSAFKPTLAVVGVALLGAFGYVVGVRDPAPSELVLGRVSLPVLSLVYVAEARDLFRSQKVKVDIRPYELGREAMRDLLAGRVEVATVYNTPVLMKALEGAPLRVLSTVHSAERQTGIIARTDRGIRRAEDLVGKTIAVTKNTTAFLFLVLYLKGQGIALSQVTLVETTTTDMIDSVVSGRVDAAATWEPNLSKVAQVLGEGKTVKFLSDNFSESCLVVTTAATIEKKRPALLKFLKALLLAEEYARANPGDVFTILTKALPDVEPNVLRMIWETHEPQVTLDNVLLLTLRQDLEVLHADAPHFPKDLIDSSLLRAVEPDAVTILGANSP